MSNKTWLIIPTVLFIIILAIYFIQKRANKPTIMSLPTITQTSMITIASQAFKQGETIPTKYTCDGEDINPPLIIENTPAQARSLVLIVDDPDAPVGTFTHWIMWNLPPTKKEISEDMILLGGPPGENSTSRIIEGENDVGDLGYAGPCPPSGTHRYFFRVFALDTALDLRQGAKRAELEVAMKNHIIDQGELMGKYSR